MLTDLFTDLKEAPERLRDAPTRLRNSPRVREVRHRVHLARGEGQERLWTFQLTALERAEGLLNRGRELPVLSGLVPTAERLVHGQLEATLSLPIAGYDALNARKASKAVRGLDRVDLLKVRRHEAATKDRKTVYQAIDKELEKLNAMPEA